MNESSKVIYFSDLQLETHAHTYLFHVFIYKTLCGALYILGITINK